MGGGGGEIRGGKLKESKVGLGLLHSPHFQKLQGEKNKKTSFRGKLGK